MLSQQYVMEGSRHTAFWDEGAMIGAPMGSTSDLQDNTVFTTGLVPGFVFVEEGEVCLDHPGQWIANDGRKGHDFPARFTLEVTGLPVCFARIIEYETGAITINGSRVDLSELF